MIVMKKRALICSALMIFSSILGGCAGNGSNASSVSNTEAGSSEPPQTSDTSASETKAEEPAVHDYGEMRDMTVQELVSEMKTGWNLGNTLDATGGETAWGNPVTTKKMIDTVVNAGFNVIRIPTTWGDKIDTENGYKVSEEWMKRVHEVVDYAFDNGAYVILNTHHETGWVKPSMDEVEKSLPEFKALWTQIAEEFEPYGDHLIFEGLNEPRIEGGQNEWSGGTPDGREALNILNKTFVETVRATGGNNEKRVLLITSFAAAIISNSLKDLEMPDDDRVAVSLHAYTPYNFTYNINESWEIFEFGDNVKKEIDQVFDIVDKYFIDKNIPVIMTEYGSVSKSKPGEADRNDAENVKWIKYYLGRAKSSGIPCVLWDNGYYYSGNELFGVFERKYLDWYVPELVEAIMSVYE